ncbi:peptide/nickel transport system permease protein [Paenibacillus sp. UNCCL117]|uniref:ABC transporter permease n=1 Tax=unclassified Paenibacillus TaxID=185978 RepID=UPI000885EE6D|nr:peptide/nickel transport system permease protein [Paenibacillus sp. cl123]SFW53185.1 peptide/nickel transport system permease protein [Paenibacillus sp. UNCCL117]
MISNTQEAPVRPQELVRASGRIGKAAPKWLRLLLQSKTGTIGFVILTLVTLTALLAPWLAPYDPNEQHVVDMLAPPFWLEGGSFKYILGTDNLGRDLLSRLIYGAQVSLFVGFFSVVVAGLIGLAVGLVSGYYGGWLDNVFMRIVDAFLAIPNILFTLVILKLTGPGLMTLIVVLGVTNWVVYARVIRSEVLSVKEREFVRAARSIGVRDTVIMVRHLLPNIFSSFSVIATLSMATTIIAEASLSFLGLGIQPPTISWGGMLSSGREYLATNWALATFPGIAITLTTLGIIFLGDWLRDVFDPRSSEL